MVLSALKGLFQRRRAPASALGVSVVRGRSYGPPQSEREIRAFVTRMRETLNDDKLDIRWNPTFKLVQGGGYTATGHLIPPVYDGRWQVIRESPRDHEDDSGFVVICTVRTYTRFAGIISFLAEDDSGYEPVDSRLLELLRAADSQNVRQFEELRKRIWAVNDATEASGDRINESEAREGLDHAHFKANYAGGVGNWKGKGVDLDASGNIIKP